MIMSISGFVDTILVSTLKSVSITESEFVQAALTGRIPLFTCILEPSLLPSRAH